MLSAGWLWKVIVSIFSAVNVTKYTNKLDKKSELVQSKIEQVFWERRWISGIEVNYG